MMGNKILGTARIFRLVWRLFLFGALILLILSLFFPDWFKKLSNWLVYVASTIDWEYLRMEYLFTFWTFQFLIILLILPIFKFQQKFGIETFTIKMVGVLGFIVFIHFIFVNFSFLTFIDDIFEKLKLMEAKGYVVGSILAFTAILWGLHLANERLAAFQSQNLEDRFIRSVELTGNKNLAIRLGGLAGLRDLSHENAQMYERVWEYLGSFLRHPPELEEGTFPRKNKYAASEQNGDIITEIRPDIKYITKLLRERNEQQQKWEK